jgi:hypothetical protein
MDVVLFRYLASLETIKETFHLELATLLYPYFLGVESYDIVFISEY